MNFDVITLFPGMFDGVLSQSIVARAIEAGAVEVRFTDPRDFTTDRHRSVDDKPYGGGPGMVLQPGPIFAAAEAVAETARAAPERTRKILLSPQGRRLDQSALVELSSAEWIVLLCGHYEGFDERIRIGLGFEELSIGDYVLTGGEIPAMAIIDGVSRLLPGVLGNPDSLANESFTGGCLECPQYTRPREFRGMDVPGVLLSGDHQKVAEWRREASLRKTRRQRRDLLEPDEIATSDETLSGEALESGEG